VTKTRFEVPTWNAVYAMLLSQAARMRKDHFKPDVILGVSRGGWVPARIHSDLLENSTLATIRTECYIGVGKAKAEPVLTQPLSMPLDGKTVLVVDDVADTGRSLKLVKEQVMQKGAQEVRVATLFRKPWSVVKPDYCERETKLWVVFPWDIKETIRKTFETRGAKSVETESSRLEEAGLPKKLVAKFLKEMRVEKPC
jgi:hypoxanthine phosphoribosyltransferase